MIDSLPSCATLHPFEPPRIIVQHCSFKGRRAFVRRQCSRCQSIRASRQPRAKGDFVSREPREPTFKPYCVLPRLSWPPPEFSL